MYVLHRRQLIEAQLKSASSNSIGELLRNLSETHNGVRVANVDLSPRVLVHYLRTRHCIESSAIIFSRKLSSRRDGGRSIDNSPDSLCDMSLEE